jgi:hypothetical protein
VSASVHDRLIAEARALGFVVLGSDGRKHTVVQHPRTGKRVHLPSTVPDRRRRIVNYRSMLRRAAGVSNQGQVAAEGERKRRRKPRRVDPQIAKAARDRAVILAAKERQAAYARRVEELRGLDGLMRSTWT